MSTNDKPNFAMVTQVTPRDPNTRTAINEESEPNLTQKMFG